MGALRRVDLEAILDFLVDASELEFDAPFPARLVARVSELVPSADMAYLENDLVARRTPVMVGRAGAVQDDEDDLLYWRVGPCPLTTYRVDSRDLAAMRLSDVTDRRRYVETPVYREYFAPYHVEHLLEVGLPASPGQLRSFLFCRTKAEGDFSQRDRAVLDALRPHFAWLEAEADLRRRLAEVLLREEHAGEDGARALLTTREREIVDLVADGKTNAEIAARLSVAPSTVKKHLEHVYEKLDVSGRAAAATRVRS
jgi:DNA-binding CsgD family transcriptional regulator